MNRFRTDCQKPHRQPVFIQPTKTEDMKRLTTCAAVILSAIMLVPSCKKEDINAGGGGPELVTPSISARLTEQVIQDQPFTGILEIYPCDYGTSVYYGNYVNGSLMPLGGYYTIVKGDIFGENNRRLHLPIGKYTMVYWGTPKHEEPIDNRPVISSPGLRERVDVSGLYFALRPYGDGTYCPTFDLVHAIQDVNIGKEDITAPLMRVTAGLKINLRKEDQSAFSEEITNIRVEIGGIAEKLNFFTAEAENTTKTVRFDLQRSADGTLMSNPTVMLFPSSPAPKLDIIITLKDGSVHKASQTLTSGLSANTLLTLDITVGKILPEGNPGDFSITDWNEENETINFPVIE